MHRAVTTVADEEAKQAAVRLSEHLRSLDDKLEDGPIDPTVSADGSWPTRGFTSLHGLVFVISQDTLQFNKGSISISQRLKEMSINPGPNCIPTLHRLNHNRIIHSYIKSKNTKLERKLNEGGRSEVEGNGGGEKAGSGFELLNEAMTREEVEQALDRLK